jgi:carboxyl-terminal processing protease
VLTLNQAVEKMRGPENFKIKLKIMRKGQDKPIEISIRTMPTRTV